MCLYTITAGYIKPLEAAHARNGDDRYDLVGSGAAGKPSLDLTDQLQHCSIASTASIRLISYNVLAYY